MTHLIYIHGFNSSPGSHKAQQTERWLAENAPDVTYHCPQLPMEADSAMAMLEAAIKAARPGRVGLIGSSMGGHYASWLATRYGLRAVLVNPAVSPQRRIHAYLGENRNYHTGEVWTMTQDHVEQFGHYDELDPQPRSNLMVLVQEGDEVLDYREAVARYAGAKLVVEPGGDHSFIGYDLHLPAIYRFLTQQ